MTQKPTKMTEFLRARDLEPGDRIIVDGIAREVVRVTTSQITPHWGDGAVHCRIQWGIRCRVELAVIAGYDHVEYFSTPDDEEWDWVELEDRS